MDSTPGTPAAILAEECDPDRLIGDFAFCVLRVSLPFLPHQVESGLTPEQRADLRSTVEARGLARGSLIYALDGRRRVVNLDTGRARWADEERPVLRRGAR